MYTYFVYRMLIMFIFAMQLEKEVGNTEA